MKITYPFKGAVQRDFLLLFFVQFRILSNFGGVIRIWNTVGTKSIFSRHQKVSTSTHYILGSTVDELEKKCFWHLTQNGQDFFLPTISNFSNFWFVFCGSPKSQHFCGSFFWPKKSATLPWLNLKKQLLIENLLRTRWQRANKKKWSKIGQELDLWEVSSVLLYRRTFQERDEPDGF